MLRRRRGSCSPTRDSGVRGPADRRRCRRMDPDPRFSPIGLLTFSHRSLIFINVGRHFAGLTEPPAAATTGPNEGGRMRQWKRRPAAVATAEALDVAQALVGS